MSARIDHAAISQRIVSAIAEQRMGEDAAVIATMLNAHREAVLALVEQQRIANLITLANVDTGEPGASAYAALVTLSQDVRETVIDPDIAAALGIEAGDDE